MGIPAQDPIRRYLKHGTLPQLRAFEASVRLGSLARAAEELHMAPPTATVQVKKLAETVGAPLLEVIGNRIYPTEVGRRVYESCGELFRAFATLEQAIAGMRGLDAGSLRLAASSSACHFAPRLLGAFAARHPGIETSLSLHNRARLIERLDDNADDLYLLSHPPTDRDLVTQAILANPLVVVARADHALAGRRAVPFARMAQEPFLMRERGSGTRDIVEAMFARHGLVPRVRMELDGNESIREAILAGLGISVLSRYTLSTEGDEARLRCLDVEGFPIESRWQFAYPAGKELGAAASAFMQFTREAVRPAGALGPLALRGLTCS